jgi:hypothetical protein
MQKDFEKKIRIQLFDGEFNQLHDKLIAQDLELKIGPKESHKGPLKIEACLFEPEDVKSFIEYLLRLQGHIPLVTRGKRGRKKTRPDSDSTNFADTLIDSIVDITDADELFDILQKEGFIFSSYQLLKDLGLPVNLPEEYTDPDDYRILIRLTRKAKNPLNDQYDPTLLLAVSRIKDESKVLIFQFNKLVETMEMDNLKSSKIKVPNSNLTKFPHFMTQEERNKFRVEKEKLIKESERDPSKFYKRWVHMVADENKGKGIEFPRIDTIPKPF